MTETTTEPKGGVYLDERLELVRYAELPNGVRIAYDVFGSPGDPAMLLVMGLGMQMLGWDPFRGFDPFKAMTPEIFSGNNRPMR